MWVGLSVGATYVIEKMKKRDRERKRDRQIDTETHTQKKEKEKHCLWELFFLLTKLYKIHFWSIGAFLFQEEIPMGHTNSFSGTHLKYLFEKGTCTWRWILEYPFEVAFWRRYLRNLLVYFSIGSRVLQYHTSCTHFKKVFQGGISRGYFKNFLQVPCTKLRVCPIWISSWWLCGRFDTSI